jgi:hypothetical protein
MRSSSWTADEPRCKSGPRVSYNNDALRQLLALREEPGGFLSREQIEALVDWDQTPEATRRELQAELAALGAPDTAPAPRTARETDALREKGSLEDEGPRRPTLLQRIRSVLRRSG